MKSSEYYSVSTYTTAMHSFENHICSALFVLLTAICFFACVCSRFDIINSHLTQIIMCATVNYINVANYGKVEEKLIFSFCIIKIYEINSNHPQNLKSGSGKGSFLQCVCYWYNLLQCFLFFVITRRHFSL